MVSKLGPEADPTSDIPGMSIWGWMLPVELHWLMDKASTMDSVVEVGSLHGRSAFALCTACPGTVYCVDPWEDVNDCLYPSFMGNCGHFLNIVPVRGLSPDAAVYVPNVDMVFLDGAHQYGDVLADIAGWLPKTKKLICGHDYQSDGGSFPGVAEAVHAVFGKRVRCDEGTSIWYIDLTTSRKVLKGAPSGPITYTNEYDRSVSVEIEWPA